MPTIVCTNPHLFNASLFLLFYLLVVYTVIVTTLFSFLLRDHHQPSLINDVLSIMTHILNEEVSDQLIDLILRNLIQESKVSVGGHCFLLFK